MSAVEVRIPELGDFSDVDVIEVHVKPGDTLAAEDPLVTLETDKATMDVPAPRAGTVVSVPVHCGSPVKPVTVKSAGSLSEAVPSFVATLPLTQESVTVTSIGLSSLKSFFTWKVSSVRLV